MSQSQVSMKPVNCTVPMHMLQFFLMVETAGLSADVLFDLYCSHREGKPVMKGIKV